MALNESSTGVDEVLYSSGVGVDDEVLYSNGAGVGRDPIVPCDFIETAGEAVEANGAGVDWDSIPNVAGVE